MTLGHAEIQEFQSNLSAAGVFDPAGVHHEFTEGMHGKKAHFDRLVEGGDLYNAWVHINARFIRQEFPILPDVVVGVANGTNQLALDTAWMLGVKGMKSKKELVGGSKVLYLPEETKAVIEKESPNFAVVVDDVGTTGSSALQIASAVHKAGAEHVAVVITLQRLPILQKLLSAGIIYRSIINKPLPAYTPDDCMAKGFCAKGEKLIAYGQQ